MSNYDENSIKPSGKKLPGTDACIKNDIGDQIVRIDADLKRIKGEVSELKKDKTPYGMIMTSPVIFVSGLIIGLVIAVCNYIFLLNSVKQDLKYLKQQRKELIEYIDKSIPKVTGYH